MRRAPERGGANPTRHAPEGRRPGSADDERDAQDATGSHIGTGSGVSRRSRVGGLGRSRSRGSVCTGARPLGAAEPSPPEQAGAGSGEALHGQGDGVVQGTVDAPDRSAQCHRTGRGSACPGAGGDRPERFPGHAPPGADSLSAGPRARTGVRTSRTPRYTRVPVLRSTPARPPPTDRTRSAPARCRLTGMCLPRSSPPTTRTPLPRSWRRPEPLAVCSSSDCTAWANRSTALPPDSMDWRRCACTRRRAPRGSARLPRTRFGTKPRQCLASSAAYSMRGWRPNGCPSPPP